MLQSCWPLFPALFVRMRGMSVADAVAAVVMESSSGKARAVAVGSNARCTEGKRP
jgi:hypothetical protein